MGDMRPKIQYQLPLAFSARKLGKGGSESGNLSIGTLRVTNPVRQSWPAAGSESCVVPGRPGLRSVDSE